MQKFQTSYLQFHQPTVLAKALIFVLSRSFIRWSGQILLPRYLMNALNNLDETDVEYSSAHADYVVGLWRSKWKVKVAAGRRAEILWTLSHKLLEQSRILSYRNFIRRGLTHNVHQSTNN